ncbi:prenyltransferase/squalene oxidase repeat-containing protein [Flavobacterium sp.]|uniref:prenyltransferase/squalene oxidase repeat-containing protein n=1 Tax=Flavobacterium sp. TaxID=239 RepID=UPI00374DD11D
MKPQNAITLGIGATVLLTVLAWKTNDVIQNKNIIKTEKVLASNTIEEKPCVFMSVMGEQSVDGYANYKDADSYSEKIENGKKWILAAQNKDGGWGAGSHSNQQEMNPHAVSSDPATTAMTAMALYRCGYTIDGKKNNENLKNALFFLLSEIENNKTESYITKIRGTQIQRKLGENIDAVLSLQFLNQVVTTINDEKLLKRVEEAIQICVDKIEKSSDSSGKVTGAGWAGVLQSSFASSGLEQAAKNGKIKVNKDKLEAARKYQKSNYDADTENVKADDGAGVVLYAVSSSVRGSAVEAKEANELLDEAKKSGKIEKNAILNKANLEKIGVPAAKAAEYDVAEKVYNSAKTKAMREDVMNGFGNNGGEEFLSFLQTGESMIVKKDSDWKKWYDNIAGKLIKIQNQDGSWNGHHCITSPAFCTATSLLILSIENDIQNLQR